jgi:hypothetical protein
MNKRKKYLVVFGIVYLILAMTIYFGLKMRMEKKFSQKNLDEMITGSPNQAKTTDLCKVQLLGEPKVGLDYVKINFNCSNGSKSMSTLSLAAFRDKTVYGVIDEYGRIVNFDGRLSQSKLWNCSVDSQKITQKEGNNAIHQAATIDCYQSNTSK